MTKQLNLHLSFLLNMRVLLDISTEDVKQNRPFVFNSTFCIELTKRFPEVEWLFLAHPDQIQSGVLNGLTLTESRLSFKQSFLKTYFYKKAFTKKISSLQPQVIISPLVTTRHSINCYLLHTHQQIHKLQPGALQRYNLILAGSLELKQMLLEKLPHIQQQIKVVPAIPREEFKPQTDESSVQLREELCNGYQFFLLNNVVVSIPKMVQLLKAFSFFKKRLKSGMRLVINIKKNEELATLLATYKYKDDVILIEETNAAHLAILTAAAYAVIHYAAYDSYVLPQEAQCCNVPVVMLQPPSHGQQTDLYIYAPELDADAIAQQLMLLYKDEVYRNNMIQNGAGHLPAYSAEAATSALFSFIKQ